MPGMCDVCSPLVFHCWEWKGSGGRWEIENRRSCNAPLVPSVAQWTPGTN